MNFVEIQNAVIEQRFKPAERTAVKAWINSRAERLWTSARWAFAVSGTISLNLTIGSEEASFPALLRVVEHVFDEQGRELAKVPLTEFNLAFRPDKIAGRTARPRYFAVRNRTIVLGPVPDQAYAFTCDGLLVFGHDSGSGAFAAGNMTADTHKPYWPENHHYLLVPGAKAAGTKLRNDPTYPALEDEFESLYTAMVDELAEDHALGPYAPLDPL